MRTLKLVILIVMCYVSLQPGVAAQRRATRLDDATARKIVLTAREYGLPPMLFLEVMRKESAFDPNATSYKIVRDRATGQRYRVPTAHGLMQMIPETARAMGVTDPYDPDQAILGGARYLRHLTDMYGSDRLDLILAAYNAGPGAVAKYRGVPPYNETIEYVERITKNYFAAEALAARGSQPAAVTGRTVGRAPRPTRPVAIAEARKRVLSRGLPSLGGGQR